MPIARQYDATTLSLNMYPCNAPSLGISAVIIVVHVIVSEHGARGHLGGVECAASEDARRRRVHHGRAGAVEAIRRGVHGELGMRGSPKVGAVWQRLPRGDTGRSVVL